MPEMQGINPLEKLAAMMQLQGALKRQGMVEPQMGQMVPQAGPQGQAAIQQRGGMGMMDANAGRMAGDRRAELMRIIELLQKSGGLGPMMRTMGMEPMQGGGGNGMAGGY